MKWQLFGGAQSRNRGYEGAAAVESPGAGAQDAHWISTRHPWQAENSRRKTGITRHDEWPVHA
jgi:hypothetical protein